MKLSKIIDSFEDILQWNEKEIEELKEKLFEKRKVLNKKAKKCDDCDEKKELERKLKAVKKLIKKLKKNLF